MGNRLYQSEKIVRFTILKIAPMTELRLKSLLFLRQKSSHYGTLLFDHFKVKTLKINISILVFCYGILCAFLPVPDFKRKTEMENFEGKVNYNLLHTYLYVSYLDALNELNKIELKNHKNSYLKSICSEPNFANNLCLNLIMSENDLIKSFGEPVH
jgi:hypothetical protein